MNQASKFSGKQGLQERMPQLKQTAANVTSYTDNDTALRDGTLYYYRVSATNAAGDSAFSNEASGITPLARPTLCYCNGSVVKPKSTLPGLIIRSSETGYKIERKIAATGTYAQIAQVGANVQSYSDTNGLAPNTKYYYQSPSDQRDD